MMFPMARARKTKKKSGFFSFLKLKTATKKRLVRASLLVNLTILVIFIFAVRRDGFAVTFQNVSSFVSAPISTFKWPVLPRNASKVSATSKAVPNTRPFIPQPKPLVQPKAVPAPIVRRTPPIIRTLSASKPKLVFVIDDMGHTLNDRDILRSLGRNVTYAILPHLAYSRFFGLLSAETGAEVILHQPFEAKDGTIPGPGLITDRMSADQSLGVLRHSLENIPNYQGVNNHMGSRGTANPALMTPLLRELKQRHVFFLDSMTSADSVCTSIARQIGLPALKRDVFLDNVDEVQAIRAQVRSMVPIARRKGYAISIGHYRHNTLFVLRDEIQKLKAEGFEIVTIGELIRFLQQKNAL
jgi:polysaccharide deacetylase 2 family uncharacterized protein YibQ